MLKKFSRRTCTFYWTFCKADSPIRTSGLGRDWMLLVSFIASFWPIGQSLNLVVCRALYKLFGFLSSFAFFLSSWTPSLLEWNKCACPWTGSPFLIWSAPLTSGSSHMTCSSEILLWPAFHLCSWVPSWCFVCPSTSIKCPKGKHMASFRPVEKY